MIKLNQLLIAVLIIMAIGFAFTADVSQAEIMDVTATVSGSCNIATVPSFNLTYVSMGTEETAIDVITTDCTAGTAYHITLDPLSPMIGPDELGLNFEVYSDSGCSVVWVDDGATGIPGTGSESHDVCVAIPELQEVAPGEYTGEIVITVNID